MKLPIKQCILDNQIMSYATDSEVVQKIDCGDGINIHMVSDYAQKAALNISLNLLSNYPHSTTLRETLKNLWADYADIPIERIFLGDGAQSLLYDTARLFVGEGDKVLGIAPTYPLTPSDVVMWGGQYDAVCLREEQNYKFDANEMLSRMDGSHKLIIIDNPNNPTGQIIPLAEIERVVSKAADLETPIIIDEAYGDYMENADSVVNIINRYDNLIWIKSLSKGYGLAGIRAGYGVIPNSLILPMQNITHPYIMSAPSRMIAETVLHDKGFLALVNSLTKEIKAALPKNLKNLSYSHTAPTVSICVITHRDKDFDLQKAFNDEDICVASGIHFLNLAKNQVRFRIPAEKDMDYVCEAIKRIDRL